MKRRWVTICALALAGCLAAGGYIAYYKLNEAKGIAAYEDVKNAAKGDTETTAPGEVKAEAPSENDASEPKTETPAAEETEQETEPSATPEAKEPTPLPTEPPLEIPIDFEELKKENEEIYAWITIPDTVIDYPVLQSSTDDSFYIHRGLDKEYLFAGAIYTEMQNSKDFTDSNTVLYGHNMKDGSMFAGLHNFHDREYFDKNREILVYTPEHIYHYEIFAAYPFDDRHLLNAFDTKSKEGFEYYLEEVYSVRAMDAFFLEKPKVTADDKIITLSTCIGSAPTSRYLVQGVLTETE